MSAFKLSIVLIAFGLMFNFKVNPVGALFFIFIVGPVVLTEIYKGDA